MIASSFGPVELMLDVGLMSLLLLGAQVLRVHSRLLQATFLPTSILAGIVALAGGPYGLAVLPFAARPDGSLYLAGYPGLLIALIFAALPLARPVATGSFRDRMRHVGDTFCYNLVAFAGQYGVALLFGVLVLQALFPGLPAGFAVLLPAGWVGGFGTAAAIGTVLEPAGFADALPLGYTSATVGVVVGTAGGMALIHLGMRRGWTRVVGRPEALPDSFRTGFYPPGERTSTGQETTNAAVIDTLTWHLALVLGALALAYLASSLLPAGHGVPLFAVALLTGWFVRGMVGLLGLEGTLNTRILGRIGSSAADYLVGFGMASIAVTVVIRYVTPLLLLFALGLALTLVMFWLGHRIFTTYWFERSIFTFGWSTSVLATSIALLRVVDPKGQSRTLEDYGTAYLGNSFIELGIVTLVPMMIVRGHVSLSTTVLLGLAVAALLVSRFGIGWSPAGPAGRRPGEDAAVQEE